MMNYELGITNGGICRPLIKRGCPSFIPHSSFLIRHSHRAFTLVEMLVVIGIIATLVGASLAGFNKIKKSADRAQAQELVSNVATALTAMYDKDGLWPKRFREAGEQGGVLDKDTALVLANRGYMALTMRNNKLSGNDRFGILTPWAAKYVSRNLNASKDDTVSGKSTVEKQLLHFAVDVDGDGKIIGANVGGETVNIRATAAVWCVGKSGGDENGDVWPYSTGRCKDDVHSWTYGQTQGVE